MSVENAALKSTRRGTDYALFFYKQEELTDFDKSKFIERLQFAKDTDTNYVWKDLGNDTVLVADEHSCREAMERGNLSPDALLARVKELLDIPEVADTVGEFPCELEGREIVPTGEYQGTLIAAVAVIDNQNGLIYVLESGCVFAHIKTVLDFGPGAKCGKNGTIVLFTGTLPLLVAENNNMEILTDNTEYIHIAK